MANINVLMATYNGERYIDKQILSVIAQTHQDWQLIIHDDGSTDKTVEIVKHFCEIDSRIIFIDDSFKARNAAVHFMYMLRFADAPYICFCDQDDVWVEKKIEIMHNAIKTKNNDIPQVVFSNAYLFDDKTNDIYGKLLFVRPTKLKEILFTNGGIHGSASMFNLKMKECMSIEHSFVAMHDHVLTLIGCSFGQISYLDEKLFLYRQHQRNITGNMDISVMARLKKAFGSNTDKYVLSCSTINGIKSFRESYSKQLTPNDVLILDTYLDTVSCLPIKRFFSIISNGYTLNHSRVHLWIKLLTRKFISDCK